MGTSMGALGADTKTDTKGVRNGIGLQGEIMLD